MDRVDIKGIWHNSKEYERNIISGMRPTFLIKDDYLTTGMIEFGDNLHNYEGKAVSVWFISPEYYPNYLWKGKIVNVFDGNKCMGTIEVRQVINPILDVDGEKYVLIDGRDINNIDDFYRIIYKKIANIEAKDYQYNLDSLDEILTGGFGFHKYGEPLHIVWIYYENSIKCLGDMFFEVKDAIQNHKSGVIELKLYKEHAFD